MTSKLERRVWTRLVGGTALVAGCLVGSPAEAAKLLDALPLSGQKVRVDGLLREYPGSMDKLSVALKGKAGSDPRAAGKIGYDKKNVYVGMRIYDKKLVRTSAAGPSEDHAVLTLTVPTPSGGSKTSTFLLYPGVRGKAGGTVKLKGRGAVAGAKLVEAQDTKGLTLEAQIPWARIAGASKIRSGLKASLKYVDSDSAGSISGIIGTSRAPVPLLLENEQGLRKNLLDPKSLGLNPARAAYGNVSGGSKYERVAIHGRYLTIVGFDYRKGTQFFFKDLDVQGAGMVRRLSLIDFDGDGRKEVLVVRRSGGGNKYREMVWVLKLDKQGQAAVVFQHETGISTENGTIANKLVVVGGAKPAIRIEVGKTTGFDPDSYAEPRQADMPDALMPWKNVGSRTFAWDGSKFDKVKEKIVKPSYKSKATKRPKRPSGPPPPMAPRPPTAGELQDQVYALYRKERKVGKTKPRFDFVTDVAADSRPERVLIHGKDIVVFGKGFRSGTSYTYISIAAKRAQDILHVTARDLTGDGKAEIIVRLDLPTKTSKEFGEVLVHRRTLVVYKVGEQGLSRIFAAETSRKMEGNRIVGALKFIRGKKGYELELRSGTAKGWTQKTYPFPVETATSAGFEPLLVPWGALKKIRYRYDGTKYQRQ